MKQDQHGNHLDELDLAIANMGSEEEEIRAGEVLRGLRGIYAVQLMERGALVSYRSDVISMEEITTTLHRAGFRAGVFQDSATGKTGKSTV
jgi:hypothetical protein